MTRTILEPQGLILDSARAGGLLKPETVEGLVGARRDRLASSQSPVLKVAADRQGLSKAELDRVLELFWAQNGARRTQLLRSVEERIVAAYLIEAGLATEDKVQVAEQELEERSVSGDPVRLLSIMVDSGVIDENAARQTVGEVQKSWRFCKYCLSCFRSAGPGNGGGGGGDACGVCGRPLAIAARTYEIVKTKTIADFGGGGGRGPAPAPAAAAAAAAQAARMPEVGETIAGIKLLERVDTRGRGTVFRGQRPDGAARAVKVWQASRDLRGEDIARFVTAALSASKLDHPGIMKVFEAGEERGMSFMVEEWVEGRSLRGIVDQSGPLPATRAARVLVDVLKALEAAHKEKLLHKNLTPGNIFVVDGDRGVKVGDFGVAKDYGVSLDTVRGNIIGAPDFLAPEQCQGVKADERTDLFSLGAALYFALSGKKPFEGESTVTLIVKRLTTDPVPLRRVAPKVPREFAEIVAKLMARKADDRFASAREARAAVEKWRAQVEAGLAGAEEAPGWRKVAIGAGIVLAMALVVGLVIGLHRLISAPPEPFLREVRKARGVADQGLQVVAAEELRKLADREGGSGVATGALAEVAALALARAQALARESDYPKAIDLLRKVRPAVGGLGLEAESDLAEAQRDLERRREEYEREAGSAFGELDRALAGLAAAEALEKVREYRARFPHQPLDRVAGEREEALAARIRQVELCAEAEAGVQEDPEGAYDLLAQAKALADPPEAGLAPRMERLEREIAFAKQVLEGGRRIEARAYDEARQHFERAGEIFPGRQEVRRGIARAEYEEMAGRAREAEDALDLKSAVELLSAAVGRAAEAGIDRAPIIAHVRELEGRLKAELSGQEQAQLKIAEGDEHARSGNWAAALAAYEEGRKLLPTTAADLERKIESARRNAGELTEEKAWSAVGERLKKARRPEDKIRLLDEFLRKFPQGEFAPQAREQAGKLRLKAGPGAAKEAAPAADRPKPMRPSERPGEFVNPGDGSVMVLVRAGKFVRGTSPEEAKRFAADWGRELDAFAHEQPRQEVWLGSFYIDVYETTNADYALFLAALAGEGAHPSRWCHPKEPREKRGHEPAHAGDERYDRADLPVVGVDWWDAWAFARWAGKRLPTEAEWEKAARGEDGRIYPWGDADAPFLANTAETWVGRKLASVADWTKAFYTLQPWKDPKRGFTVSGLALPEDRSPYGAKHLGGNVWEWVEDWYHPDAYSRLGARSPVASEPPKARPAKVVRGGAWLYPLLRSRAASRQELEPGRRNNFTGFRCARSADG